MTWTFALGSICAFGFASMTVLYDCHLALKTRLKRVPIPIYKSKEAWLVSLAVGLVALIAFRFTSGKGDSAIDAILTLKQPQDVVRGICVGLTVLVLIQSKLTTVKGSELGGELFYAASRGWVVQRVNQSWGEYKQRFNNRNLDHALATLDFEDLVVEQISQSIKVNDEDYRNFVLEQIKNLKQNQPSTAFNATQSEWRRYYRTLTNLALDYAGQNVFRSWAGFSVDV